MKKTMLLFSVFLFCSLAVPITEKSEEKNLYEVMAADPDLSEFLQMLKENGLADSLKSVSLKFTVFAPVNDAIQNMDSVKRNFLFGSGTGTNVMLSLSSHFAKHIHDYAELEQLPEGAAMKNLAYGKNVFHNRDGEVYIHDAKIIAKDIRASNGIIHKIDRFILYVDKSQ